jgi:hypothetical protein
VSSQDQTLLDFMTSRTLEAVIFEARRRGSVALELDDIHQDHFSAALHTIHHTHSLKKWQEICPRTALKLIPESKRQPLLRILAFSPLPVSHRRASGDGTRHPGNKEVIKL